MSLTVDLFISNNKTGIVAMDRAKHLVNKGVFLRVVPAQKCTAWDE